MRSAAPDSTDTELRRILGAFLFSGETVDQRAGTLSGGEKTRLAMATLVVSGANVLLLDEPTNNLDPASREQVLEALRTYAGAIVLVTHDEGAVRALNPDKVILLPDGTEDAWSEDLADLVDWPDDRRSAGSSGRAGRVGDHGSRDAAVSGTAAPSGRTAITGPARPAQPGADMGRRLTRRGVMADSSTADLGKGKRITGGDRSSLADELRKRYDGGESIRSLATSTNRSYGFVHRLLSESGATLRSRGGANRNSKKA